MEKQPEGRDIPSLRLLFHNNTIFRMSYTSIILLKNKKAIFASVKKMIIIFALSCIY